MGRTEQEETMAPASVQYKVWKDDALSALDTTRLQEEVPQG